MWNWSVDEKKFKKEHPEEYRLWRLTQLINYGLDGEKLDREEVKAAWPKIKDGLDPYAKRFYLTGGTALSEFYLHHRFRFFLHLAKSLETEIFK